MDGWMDGMGEVQSTLRCQLGINNPANLHGLIALDPKIQYFSGENNFYHYQFMVLKSNRKVEKLNSFHRRGQFGLLTARNEII